MGKAGRWLKNLLTGQKNEKERKGENFSFLPQEYHSAPIQVVIPRDKKRWSFRRSVGAGKSNVSGELFSVSTPSHGMSDTEVEQKRHAMALAAATAAAADAAVAAAQAAAAVVRLTSTAANRTTDTEDKSATMIQAAFRGYLARKALCALRGLVKLQALIRGHLVRKQAATALRCMQALVTAQARVREQKIRYMVEESQSLSKRPSSSYRRSPQHPRSRQSYEMDRNEEENIKIVEVDFSGPRVSTKSRNSYSYSQPEARDARFAEYYGNYLVQSKADKNEQFSPAPSALTEMTPRSYSGHFEDFSFPAVQSSPQYFPSASVPDHTFFPNYMANTESWRAKARSQSAPRQRSETNERQTSRRRASVEGRNIPRSVKMQRSSSHVGLTGNGFQDPWSVKLDKSSMSLQDSECGSTSTVMTNENYCRSMVGFDVSYRKAFAQ